MAPAPQRKIRLNLNETPSSELLWTARTALNVSVIHTADKDSVVKIINLTTSSSDHDLSQ